MPGTARQAAKAAAAARRRARRRLPPRASTRGSPAERVKNARIAARQAIHTQWRPPPSPGGGERSAAQSARKVKTRNGGSESTQRLASSHPLEESTKIATTAPPIGPTRPDAQAKTRSTAIESVIAMSSLKAIQLEAPARIPAPRRSGNAGGYLVCGGASGSQSSVYPSPEISAWARER